MAGKRHFTLPPEESPVGCAEVIALSEVRTRKPWETLRQQLQERFDRWLDEVEAQLCASAPTLAQVSETIWALRPQLTGGVAQTLIEPTHQEEQRRQFLQCTTCAHLLRARPVVSRTVETMLGAIELARPSFSCRHCHRGRYPLDAVLGWHAGRLQLDVQQAAADLAIALPLATAATQFERLSGISVRSERLHTCPHRVAEGLSLLDGAPSREEIDRRVAQVAQGRFRRPVLVLGIDGAYVPSRPERARGRRPGQAHQRARRARWKHEGREAQGVRLYLLDGERIVPVLSWPQIQNEHELGEALQEGKEAGVIPAETVRLCVMCDGAEWLWKHVQALLPHARQVRDYSHCAEYLHKVATAQYGNSEQAQEWVEATLTRLYMGKGGQVLGGLRRMQPTSEEALKAIAHCGVSLNEHRGRTTYRQFRRGGYPLGSGGMESANQFICHVRLKRSGAWWYEENSNQMLARRCAKYNSTFDRVFTRLQRQRAAV
jgi:hypothetical protein